MKLLIDTHYLLWLFMNTAKISNKIKEILMLDNEDLIFAYRLPIKHKDPFDRMIIWQAIKGKMTLLPVDSKMDEYIEYGLKVLKF